MSMNKDELVVGGKYLMRKFEKKLNNFYYKAIEEGNLDKIKDDPMLSKPYLTQISKSVHTYYVDDIATDYYNIGGNWVLKSSVIHSEDEIDVSTPERGYIVVEALSLPKDSVREEEEEDDNFTKGIN